MSRIAYTRLFRDETQENAEGLSFLHIMEIDAVYSDPADQELKQRNTMLSQCHANDVIVCQSIACCSKDSVDFLAFTQQVKKHGGNLLCLEENFDLSKSRSKWYLELMQAQLQKEVSEAEPALVTKEDTVVASHRKGRRPKTVDEQEFERLYGMLLQKQITKKEMQEELGVCYVTLQKMLCNYASSSNMTC